MKIGVQMDDFSEIDFASDGTVALMSAAQRRGGELFVFAPQAVFVEDGVVRARGADVRGSVERGGPAPELAASRLADLARLDVVLVRQNPPYDDAYHANTFLLELLADEVRVLNDPAAIRDTHEKLAALRAADLMPPTFVGRDVEAICAFAARFEDVVVKPLSLFAGQGIFRRRDEPDFRAALQDRLAATREPLMVQEFLPGVGESDKRVMFLNGEIEGVLGRVPPEGGFVANIHAGGRAVAQTLTPRDQAVCDRLGPLLRDWGVYFAGVDLIDGNLTEVNVTCPTLIYELIDVGGPDIAELFWSRLPARG